MTELRHVGEDRPTPVSGTTWARVPPAVADMLARRGPGLLAGQVRLFAPDGATAVDARARFDGIMAADTAPSGWAWLADLGATAILIGEVTLARGFVFAIPLDVARSLPASVWIAHSSGVVVPVGHAVESLVDALTTGVIVDLDGAALDRELGIEPTYDTRDLDSELSAALRSGDESAIDAALASFLDSGFVVDRLVAAVALADEAGAAGDVVRDTARTLRRRNRFHDELAKVRGTREPERRAAFLALGCRGSETIELDMRVLSAGQPPLARASVLAAGIAAAEAALPEPARAAWREALARCSPDDAFSLTGLLLADLSDHPPRPPWFSRTRLQSARLSYESPMQYRRVFGDTSEIGPLAKHPFWSRLTDIPRVWPLLAALAFAPSVRNEVPLALILGCETARDPLIADLMDHVIFDETGGRWHLDVTLELRAAIRDFTEADVTRAGQTLDNEGPPPKRAEYAPNRAYQLLTRAAHERALEIVCRHATRDMYGALRAARTRGKSPASLALLAELYANPRRFDIMVSRDAAKLAASWGDGAAKAALPALEKSADAAAKRLERM